MNIPQVLGYTRIAGTPVVTGLYTVLLPLIAFAIFGSSRHLVVAADSATAAIFSSSLSRMAPPASEKYMALVGMVALLTAVVPVAGADLQAGISRRFPFAHRAGRISHRRWVSGGIAMLGDMLGVEAHSHRTLVQAWEILQGLPRLHPLTLGLSALVAGSILLGHRVCPAVACFTVRGGRDHRGEC